VGRISLYAAAKPCARSPKHSTVAGSPVATSEKTMRDSAGSTKDRSAFSGIRLPRGPLFDCSGSCQTTPPKKRGQIGIDHHSLPGHRCPGIPTPPAGAISTFPPFCCHPHTIRIGRALELQRSGLLPGAHDPVDSSRHAACAALHAATSSRDQLAAILLFARRMIDQSSASPPHRTLIPPHRNMPHGIGIPPRADSRLASLTRRRKPRGSFPCPAPRASCADDASSDPTNIPQGRHVRHADGNHTRATARLLHRRPGQFTVKTWAAVLTKASDRPSWIPQPGIPRRARSGNGLSFRATELPISPSGTGRGIGRGGSSRCASSIQNRPTEAVPNRASTKAIGRPHWQHAAISGIYIETANPHRRSGRIAVGRSKACRDKRTGPDRVKSCTKPIGGPDSQAGACNASKKAKGRR